MYYEKLTENRKRFVDQLMPLIESTFDREIEEEERIKTISIDASWGMGKTLLKDVLVEKLGENGIRVKAINAWETDYFSDPMKSLIGEINESDLNISSDTIEKGEKLIKNIGGVATKIFGTALLKKLNFTDEDITNIKSIFQGIDSSGVEEYKKYKDLVKKFKESFGVSVGTSKRVIILDELDRCKPNYAIELLEAIKHIFDIYNLTFIFLINKEQLKYTVENLYGCNRENEDYFEKFFDLQLILPEIDIVDFVQIEYESYKYDLESFQPNGVLNFEKFMISLLLKLIMINYNEINMKSVRQLRKSLNKYIYLIKTFSENEKKSLFTILGFVAYFFDREYNMKDILSKNNTYRFDIRKIVDNFLTKESRGDDSSDIRSIDRDINRECLFRDQEILNFYILLAKNEIKIKNCSLDENITNLYQITAEVNEVRDSFRGRYEEILMLPLSVDYILKHGSYSLAQWCKEKYEFTHYID
ncbi:KAP family P-loop NTPase fold protein [Cetobacterium somerae]